MDQKTHLSSIVCRMREREIRAAATKDFAPKKLVRCETHSRLRLSTHVSFAPRSPPGLHDLGVEPTTSCTVQGPSCQLHHGRGKEGTIQSKYPIILMFRTATPPAKVAPSPTWVKHRIYLRKGSTFCDWMIFHRTSNGGLNPSRTRNKPRTALMRLWQKKRSHAHH